VLIAADNTCATIMEVFDKIVDTISEDFTGSKTVIHPGYKA